MNLSHKRRQSLCTSQRRGAAAVECAILVPILTLLLLGAIDVGQFANVYQKISDASREGARLAARYGTKTTSEVESGVRSYLTKVAGGGSGSALAAAANVTVSDSTGNPIPGGDLEKSASGSQIRVRVSLMYDPVRWIGGFKGLDGSEISAMSMMRRE
jgi:Flp pilus assembly protein TadG